MRSVGEVTAGWKIREYFDYNLTKLHRNPLLVSICATLFVFREVKVFHHLCDKTCRSDEWVYEKKNVLNVSCVCGAIDSAVGWIPSCFSTVTRIIAF